MIKRLSVRGARGMAANFYARIPRVRGECVRETKTHGRAVMNLATQLAPRDTGLLQDSITVEFSPSGLAYEVFCDPAEFASRGEPYYAGYVEHGTSVSPEQPFMGPAHAALEPQYIANIRRAIQRGIQSVRTRAARAA